MLILSRREAECICLGDDIVLTIVSLGHDKVRIGVQAPSGIKILRSELERNQTIPLNAKPETSPAVDCGCQDETRKHRAAA